MFLFLQDLFGYVHVGYYVNNKILHPFNNTCRF